MSVKRDKLWASLEQAIAEEPELDFEQISHAEVEETTTLSDRLASTYLNGFLPLLILHVLALVFTGYNSQLALLGGGLLLAPLLVGLCRPLIAGARGVHPLAFLTIAPFYLVLLLFAQLLPLYVYHRSTVLSNDHITAALELFLATKLQDTIEHLATPHHLSVLAFLALGLLALAPWLRYRFPWISPSKPRRASKALAFLVLLSPYLALSYFLYPDPEISRWSQKAALSYKTVGTPLKTFYTDPTPIHFRLSALSKDIDSHSSSLDTDTPDAQAQLQKVESELLKLFELQAIREHDDVFRAGVMIRNLTSHSQHLSDPLRLILAADSLKYHGRPLSKGILWKREVIPWLAHGNRTPEDLKSAEEALEKLLSQRLTPQEELDLHVYSVLVLENLCPSAPTVMVRSSKGSGASTISHSSGALPMKVAGHFVEEFTPTSILAKQQGREFVRVWLRNRSRFEKPSQKELSEIDKQNHKVKDFEGACLVRLAQACRSREDSAIQETTLVFLRLRIQQLKNAPQPPTLAKIGVDDPRWSLRMEDGQLTLHDSELPEDFWSRSPWRLP